MKFFRSRTLAILLTLFISVQGVYFSEPAFAATLQADDVYQARVLAKEAKTRVLVLSELTEDSTTFVNPDGSFTTRMIP